MREVNWDQNSQMIFCAYVSKENFDHAHLLLLAIKEITLNSIKNISDPPLYLIPANSYSLSHSFYSNLT